MNDTDCCKKIVLALAGLVLSLLPRPAEGSSVMLDPPSGWNGFAFTAHLEAGFRKVGGSAVLATSNSTFMLVTPGDVVPGQVFASAPLSVSQSPTAGAAKDGAQGEFQFSFTVGQAGVLANDRFDFSLTNTTSALGALVDFGGGPVPAAAYFRAELTLRTMGPIRDTVGAFFGLPDMPDLHSPTESMTATVTKGPYLAPTTLATLGPGDTGVDVALTMASWQEAFAYKFIYEITTPYGTDPTYAYNLSGVAGTAVVPEPSTLALLGLSLLGCAACRRTRAA